MYGVLKVVTVDASAVSVLVVVWRIKEALMRLFRFYP